jgi:hypothetical protein
VRWTSACGLPAPELLDVEQHRVLHLLEQRILELDLVHGHVEQRARMTTNDH